jgi:membrane-associated phospholipid phosphatase
MTADGIGRWKLVSIAGSFPPTILATALIIAATTAATIGHAVVFGLIFSILPAAAALLFLHTGRISDIEVRDRKERHELFLIGLLSSIGGLALIEQLAVAEPLLRLGMIQAVLVPLLWFINRSWKISVHATTWGACVTALYLIVGPAALLAVPLAVTVGVGRVVLDCHTRAQVMGGFITGIVLAALIVLR